MQGRSFILAATLALALTCRCALAQNSAAAPTNGDNGAAAVTPPGQPPTATPAPQVTVFQLFFKGGFFMYPLALCSVVAVGLILERFLALRRSKVIPPAFIPGLKGVLKDVAEDREAALAYCRKHDSPIARVLGAGIKRLQRGWPVAEKAIEDEGANQAMRLRHNMRFLYALGSVGTLLGLIGTISGMIKAFQVAAVAGVGRVDQLSTGIYEAMTCTFAGLAVAIVVTTFYYFFSGRIERLLVEMNDTVNRFADDYGINEPERESEDDEKELAVA
ncbi:MAG TPA: MotA/TolQ/ExbB proton channel family protein [Tepidisphaeraceae bacterium]|jgi:biopolymer transport protein ExbB